MRFNDHSRIAGSHALLSPSKPAWMNYEDEKLDALVMSSMASARGTALHDLAQQMIRLAIKLPDNMQTLSMYVNDAIGFKLAPEQILFYSSNCYGQADAIGFRKNVLRIHDLKTGVNPCSFAQLEIYAAIFCLEYNLKPTTIEMEFRIYQNDDVKISIGDPLTISSMMSRIVVFDRRINQLREEANG